MKRTVRVSHFDNCGNEVSLYEYNPNASVEEIVDETIGDMASAGSATAMFEKDGYEYYIEDGKLYSTWRSDHGA